MCWNVPAEVVHWKKERKLVKSEMEWERERKKKQ